MALKKIYFGSVGPFLYDDADLINDPDGDFSGEYFDGAVTDGKFRQKQPASSDDDCVRKADVDAKTISYTTDTTSVGTSIGETSGSIEVVTDVNFTTTTKTVVTSVDFANETVTTEGITYVDSITVTTDNVTYLVDVSLLTTNITYVTDVTWG